MDLPTNSYTKTSPSVFRCQQLSETASNRFPTKEMNFSKKIIGKNCFFVENFCAKKCLIFFWKFKKLQQDLKKLSFEI